MEGRAWVQPSELGDPAPHLSNLFSLVVEGRTSPSFSCSFELTLYNDPFCCFLYFN